MTTQRMTRALLLLAVLSQPLAANPVEVVTVPPWELHSSFWMCLHQTLMDDARQPTPRARAGWSPEEQAAWNEAVAAYRTAGGAGDMTFARPMVITTDALTQVADDATEPQIDAPLGAALLRAAPAYRRHGWADDERANRFFIAYAAGLLRAAGEPLVRAHEAAYRTPWPSRVRVYVTPVAGQFGAYTVLGLAGGVITTMSSRDEGYQGFRALEMLLHESAHGVVGPRNGPLAAAIAAAAKAHAVAVPHDLWHALLFATSSELTRRALAQRGVTTFVPSSVDLFSRVWPKYRAPVERFWGAYLGGEGTLEQAVSKIVAALPR